MHVVARLIRTLNATELVLLRRILAEDDPGDPTGVGAIIPPNLPLQENSVAEPLPEDYWETAE